MAFTLGVPSQAGRISAQQQQRRQNETTRINDDSRRKQMASVTYYGPPDTTLSEAVQEGKKTGWKKNMAKDKRRYLVLKAHKGDELAAARSMNALANLTTDNQTHRQARADADYFYTRHRQHSGGRNLGAGVVQSGGRRHISL